MHLILTDIREIPAYNDIICKVFSIRINKSVYNYNDNTFEDKPFNILYSLPSVVGNFSTSIITDISTISVTSDIIYNPNCTVDEGYSLKIEEINDGYNEAFNAIVINYPTHEIASFPLQESQASEYLANPNADVKFLRTLYLGRISLGYTETLEELCQKILYKANVFEPVSGYLSGIRQALEKKLDNILTQVANNEITTYRGYKECLRIETYYPLLSIEELNQMISNNMNTT